MSNATTFRINGDDIDGKIFSLSFLSFRADKDIREGLFGALTAVKYVCLRSPF